MRRSAVVILALVVLAGCARQKTAPAAPGPVLQGRIVDSRGDAVPGVRVTLWGGLATRLKGQQTTTDSDGRYQFQPLETGAQILDEPSGRWDLYTGMTLEHAAMTSADGESWWDVRVSSEPGTVFTRDFTMIPGGTVEGTLTSRGTGQAIPGAGLRIQHKKNGFLRYATTDAFGRFRETALFPGEYTVDLNSPQGRYPVLGSFTIPESGGATSTALFK